MNESKAAWDQVGDRFTELGQQIKDRYEANVAFGQEDREQVDDAVKKLVESLDHTFTAIGDSIRDPDVREHLKGTAQAMGNALTTTFREVAEDIQERLGRK